MVLLFLCKSSVAIVFFFEGTQLSIYEKETFYLFYSTIIIIAYEYFKHSEDVKTIIRQ